jgi:hypothetical protein
MRGPTTWSSVFAAVVVGALGVSSARAETPLTPRDFQTKALFELTVVASPVIKPGSSRVAAQSAFATQTHGLMPGNSDGLHILFVAKRLTGAFPAEVWANGARELRKSDHATLLLYLDKDRTVLQVNLSYVIPGTAVARTVAWKPEELAQFANYRFDGRRLVLRSKGLYKDQGPDERLTLSWDVDLDLPVFDPPRP